MTTQLSGHLGNSIKRPDNLILDYFEEGRAGDSYAEDTLRRCQDFDWEFCQK
jgi:hypothetical protein